MKYKNFYLLSLLAVVLLSAYPIYMGFVTLGSYLQKGFITVTDYPKYVIPYTPICLAVMTSAALLPLIFKLCRKYTLPLATLLGTVLFFLSESLLEKVKVVEGYVSMPVESWQLSMCMATPEVLRAIGQPIFAAGNPAFKIHFYIIALIIIISVLNVLYGLSKMFRERDYSKKRLLIAQAVVLAVFIALCILACFTAFYRNGTLHISPLSAVLMSVFFIIFGLTAGLYGGTLLYGRNDLLSKIIPPAAASLTTLIMYLGELALMDGVLFRYGSGFLFKPLGALPFSAVDLVIILSSGLMTFGIMYLCRRQGSKQLP